MKDFERFKKKVLREHIIRAALVGLGLGLLAAAFAIVISFLTNPSIAVVLGIVAGLSVGGAGGYYFWHRCKPTDKKIALRLDKKLGLHERTATMIEFADKEGAIVEKQRDDAREKLAEKPTNALPFTVSIWIIPALAIASAFFAASFFTPQNKNESRGDSLNSSDPFDIDSVTHSIAEDAKSNLNSELEESIAEAMKSVMDKLESQLSGISDEQIRESYVDQAKSEIDDIVDDSTSREIIGRALKTETNIHLKNMGQALIDGSTQGMRQALQDLLDDIQGRNGQNKIDYANSVADQIDDALDKALLAGVSEDDELYQSLRQLAESLRHIAEEQQQQQQSGQQQSGEQQSGQQQSGQQQSGEQQSGQQQSGQQQSGQQQSGQQQSGQQQSGPTQADSNANSAMMSAIQEAADAMQSEMEQQSRIEQAGSEMKDAMDSMVNPQPGSEGSGSGSGSGQPGSGSGSGEATEGSGGSGEATEGSGGSGEGSGGSGEGSGEGSGSGEPGSGEGQGSGQGSGSGSGSGAGGGTETDDPHTDTIWTGEGNVEYGSVINSYGGDYVDDHRNNGNDDPEAGDAADEYFRDMYGSEAGGQGGTGGGGFPGFSGGKGGK